MEDHGEHDSSYLIGDNSRSQLQVLQWRGNGLGLSLASFKMTYKLSLAYLGS